MHCTAALRDAERRVVKKEMCVGQIESDAIRVPVRATHADADPVGVRQHDGAIAVVDR